MGGRVFGVRKVDRWECDLVLCRTEISVNFGFEIEDGREAIKAGSVCSDAGLILTLFSVFRCSKVRLARFSELLR
jgi:hypothetical protein